MAAKKKSTKTGNSGNTGNAKEAELEALRAHVPPTDAALTQTLEAVSAVAAHLQPPPEPHPSDLVQALLHIVFAAGAPCGVGREAVRRIEEGYVDRNEFRVTEAFEVADLLADLPIPDLFDRCHTVQQAIAQIYADQNAVTLDFLREAAVSDRNNFFQRVSIPPEAQRYLLNLLSFEESIFSDRSTQRAQQRLGLDPKAPAVQKFLDGLKELLAPFGHLPQRVNTDLPSGKPRLEPLLCPACLVVRLAPTKK